MRADTVVNRGGILGSVTDSDPIKTRIKQALALRGTVESPGDLAAACGIPWWTAELRLENPLVRRWLGGYERIRTQLY